MFDKLDADSPQLPTEETSAHVTPVLATALMSHQNEGLAWMVQREQNPDASGEEKTTTLDLPLFFFSHRASINIVSPKNYLGSPWSQGFIRFMLSIYMYIKNI